MDEKFWEEIREEFPVALRLAYFQSAGLSPLPDCVLQAVTRSYQKLNQYGDMFFQDDLKNAENLRAQLATMLNTRAGNINIAHNTSTAFSFVAAALKAARPEGFHLVSLMDEFPSSHIPFQYQGIPVRFVEPVNGKYTSQQILDATDSNTLGVVCSYVQYSTGFRLGLEELGKALHQKGLLFIVNATQAFPIYDVDVEKMHIDALTVSFHKWGLCGHVGSLFYTSADFRKAYPSPMAGWLSVYPPKDDFIPTQKKEKYTQYEDAGQYNFGTMNFQALNGLTAALDFMHTIGHDKIRQRINWLMDYLITSLKELPVEILSYTDEPRHQSAILLINLPGHNNAEVVDFLRKRNVVTSLRTGEIRIACNFFNNARDVDELCEALALFVESAS